jgi:hypothetical protein
VAEIHLTPKGLEARWTDTLRIKANTLANWRSSRPPRGPAYRRIGNKILYPLSAIEAFEQTGMDRSSTATPDPAAASPAAARPPAPPSAARSESAQIAALMAARDQARAEMTARLEALRRTAARLERHYSRRIDLVRGRLADAAPPAPSDASSEASTPEVASPTRRPRMLAPRVAAPA